MTFRAALHEYLRDEIDVPVYDGRLPVRPMMPALVQRLVSTVSEQAHDGPLSLLERRVQIDAYANNDAETDRLATTLLGKLEGFRGPMSDVEVGRTTLAMDLETTPEEVKGGEVRYRRILDFLFAYTEAALEP